MDAHYDYQAAKRALEDLITARAANSFAGLQLSEITKLDDWMSAYEIAEQKGPLTWRLAQKEEENIAEEAVVRLQGIICENHLLPSFEQNRLNEKRLKYLRQSITVTGLGSELFDAASENISDIYAIFSRNFPPQKLLPWTSTRFNEHIIITASNRLFTPRKDAPNQAAISIGRNLDPTGRLTEMAGGEYFHGEENMVQIWERTKNRTGEYKFTPTNPTKLQIGDIVELKVSFMVVPLRGGTFRMMIVLRGVTLLDGSYTHKAITTRSTIHPSESVLLTTLKRKVNYSEEEEGEARHKLSRMAIDEGSIEPADQ